MRHRQPASPESHATWVLAVVGATALAFLAGQVVTVYFDGSSSDQALVYVIGGAVGFLLGFLVGRASTTR